jgi:hypothetical protein
MWFTYDPYDPEFAVYPTEEEATAAFERILDRFRTEALDDGWDPDVERLCMGRVTREVVLVPIPPDVFADMIGCGFAAEGDEICEAVINEIEE